MNQIIKTSHKKRFFKYIILCSFGFCFSFLFTNFVVAPGSSVTPEGFEGKNFVGYQGWFNTPNDGTKRNWTHWSRTNPMTAQSLVFDMWPDLSEYPAAALQDTPFTLGNGATAKLFSSYNDGVIDTHFKWMQNYKIEGAFLQWFVVDTASYKLALLKKTIAIAEKYSRKTVIMLDISGTGVSNLTPSCKSGAELTSCLQSRWMSFVDAGLTNSPSYIKYKNKPLLALWGIGFVTNSNYSAQDVLNFLNWLQFSAPLKYQASIMGGVSTFWRTQGGDTIQADQSLWTQVYSKLDIVSPWTIGRYTDEATSASYVQNFVKPDIDLIRARNQKYLPVIFPGFSWSNLTKFQAPLNMIPRKGGQFLWSQARNLAQVGLSSFYTAMFDEVDEGTAIFKTAPNSNFAPRGVSSLTLDADQKPLPSDWYLQVTKKISIALESMNSTGFANPILPLVENNNITKYLAGTLKLNAGSFVQGLKTKLVYQLDGNLVIYDLNGVALWSSQTGGRSCTPLTCVAQFQKDGNLVLYQNNQYYWATLTNVSAQSGELIVSSEEPFLRVVNSLGQLFWTSSQIVRMKPGEMYLKVGQVLRSSLFRLEFQVDGNLVMYDNLNQALWASNTNRSCFANNCFAAYLGDGNLVLLQDGVIYWSSQTSSPVNSLKLTSQFPFVSLVNEGDVRVWP